MTTLAIRTVHAELETAVSPRMIALLAHLKRALIADGWTCSAEKRRSSDDFPFDCEVWTSWTVSFYANSVHDITFVLHAGFNSETNISGGIEHSFATLIETENEDVIGRFDLFDLPASFTAGSVNQLVSDTPKWATYSDSASQRIREFLVM